MLEENCPQRSGIDQVLLGEPLWGVRWSDEDVRFPWKTCGSFRENTQKHFSVSSVYSCTAGQQHTHTDDRVTVWASDEQMIQCPRALFRPMSALRTVGSSFCCDATLDVESCESPSFHAWSYVNAECLRPVGERNYWQLQQVWFSWYETRRKTTKKTVFYDYFLHHVLLSTQLSITTSVKSTFTSSMFCLMRTSTVVVSSSDCSGSWRQTVTWSLFWLHRNLKRWWILTITCNHELNMNYLSPQDLALKAWQQL